MVQTFFCLEIIFWHKINFPSKNIFVYTIIFCLEIICFVCLCQNNFSKIIFCLRINFFVSDKYFTKLRQTSKLFQFFLQLIYYTTQISFQFCATKFLEQSNFHLAIKFNPEHFNKIYVSMSTIITIIIVPVKSRLLVAHNLVSHFPRDWIDFGRRLKLGLGINPKFRTLKIDLENITPYLSGLRNDPWRFSI